MILITYKHTPSYLGMLFICNYTMLISIKKREQARLEKTLYNVIHPSNIMYLTNKLHKSDCEERKEYK